MPRWEIHRKWAKILGISDEISKEVNELIDFPEKWFRKRYSEEYLSEEARGYAFAFFNEPCLALYHAGKAWYGFGHDVGRKYKTMYYLQLRCVYKHYGVEGVKACLLHHILDYITYFSPNDPESHILFKIEEKFGLKHPPPKDVDDYLKRLPLWKRERYPREEAEIDVKIMNAQAEILEFVKKNLKQILTDIFDNK